MNLRNCGLNGLWLPALLLTALVAFWPGVHGPFVLDDIAKIRDNPELKSPFELHSFFDSYESHKTHFRNDPSRPFVYMAYWALWHVGQGTPTAFHIFSIVVHALTAFTLGLLAFNLLQNLAAAVFASFLYLLLPINAGTVLYAFGLSDVLSAFFSVILALILVEKKEWRGRELILPMILFVLGLASKQSLVVLPAILFFAKPKAKTFHFTLTAVAISYVAFRFLVYGRVGDLEAVENYEASTYLAIQGWAFWKYLLLTVIPKGLCIDHAILPRHVGDDVRTLGRLAWSLAILTAVFLYRSPRFWILGFGWLWWTISLLPTGSFMPTTDLLVERRAYWPVIGIVLIAAALFKGAWKRSFRLSLAAGILMAIALGWITHERAQVYASAESIYQEVAELYPEDLRSLGNLAVAYIESRRFTEARSVLEKVLHLVPDERNALVNLAALYQSNDSGFTDLHKAGELLSTLLAKEPDNVKALMNMGFLHLSLSQPNQAAFRFAKVVELSPCTAPALYGWGQAEKMAGRPSEAIVKWQEALKCDPGFAPAANELKSGNR